LIPTALFFLVSCGVDPRSPVVLVTIDTIRADHVSAYGYEHPTSPILDSLAATGVLFTRAYSQSNSTVPSHASILSGQHVSDHGLHDNGQRWDDLGVPTLAQYFQAAGHRTAAFVSVLHLNGPRSGFDPGFDHFDNVRHQTGPTHYGADRWTRPGERTAQRALRWVRRNRGHAYLIWVHLFEPHTPYAPDSTLANRFVDHWTPRLSTLRDLHARVIDPSEARRRLPNSTASEHRLFESTYQHRDPRRDLDQVHRLLSQADRACIEALYDGEIAQTDAVIGRLLEGLRSSSEEGDPAPLIVVVGDHGENFDVDGVYAAHRSIYEACVRVPMLLSWQGQLPEGRRVDTPVQGIDLLPTILELAELEATSALPGRSLVGACLDTIEALPQPIIIEHANRSALAMIEWPWKIIVSTAELYKPAPDVYRHKGLELFNLSDDPHEQRDLAVAEAQREQRMRDHLLAWTARRSRDQAGARVELDSLMIQELRALGYID